jgi:hypothetical protein
MNRKRCTIQKSDLAAFQDLALLADADQIRLLDQREGDSEGVHPERLSVYRIANRDVASHLKEEDTESASFIETEGQRSLLPLHQTRICRIFETRPPTCLSGSPAP